MDADEARVKGLSSVRRRGRPIAASAIVATWLAVSSTALPAREVDRPPAPRAEPPVAGPAPADPAASPTAMQPASPHGPPAATAKDLDLSPSVLKSAISAADEDYARSASHTPFGTNPSSAQAKTDGAFEAAHIEGCGSGALKFETLPVWGDFVMGVFALPYALHAMATGRCKMWSR